MAVPNGAPAAGLHDAFQHAHHPREPDLSAEQHDRFISMPQAAVKTVPLMPDQDYKWVSDEAWRTRNDALFARP